MTKQIETNFNYFSSAHIEQGQQLGVKAMHMWSEWQAVQAVGSRNSVHEQQQYTLQWQKPSQGWYKCNIDAGFHHEARKTTVGWCVRDHRGQFVLRGSYVIQGRCVIRRQVHC
ncbi:unnamed protein product [Trifolium pratense]|uniref:Uncharacterized protein n=1 Tax=Trifolium pratense TaxID=57577 RepID=A0ACB0MC80_TRIPR|nr:unnamed protein product [Trifolium pratense]